MPACCSADAYAELFDDKTARRDARHFLQKGLDPTGRRMVDVVVERGVRDATVLEVGGGVGALGIELLRAGAVRATSVDLVSTYEHAARELLETLDLTGRVERRVLDFARAASDVPQADIVLLHRVICCYPDMETLVGAAADHAGRLLALSFPADRWWWHVGRVLTNMWFRLRGCAFRLYLHHPHRILEVAEHAGLRPIMQRRGWIWQIAVLERTNAGNQSAE